MRLTKYLTGSNPWLQDVIYVLCFGLASVLFSLIQFETPDIPGNHINLREIPLLISLSFITNPASTLLFALVYALCSLVAPFEVFDTGLAITHSLPLVVIWYLLRWVRAKFSDLGTLFGMTFLCVLVYYYLLMLPIAVIYKQLVAGLTLPFIASYVLVVKSSLFEVTPTAIISSLFLVEETLRNKLKDANKNLEQVVTQRTQELSQTNERLHAAYEEMKTLNDSLEHLVQERTDKINTQLNQMVRYAHMNSHEVRGPLARILGLIQLTKIDKGMSHDEYFQLLCKAGEELDDIVKKMNRLLEQEIDKTDQ